jgi:hypothetical protein
MGNTISSSSSGFIEIPSECKLINANAFNNDNPIDLTFASNSKLKGIQADAFGPTSFRSITVPSNYINFEVGLFSNIKTLKSVDFLGKVEHFLILKCLSLQNLRINNGIYLMKEF